MSDKKYTILFLTFFSVTLLAIGVFDYIVNPFDIFNTKKTTGFNKIKPESDRRQRLSKAYVIEKNCHENLIMGNSRALAISAEYDAWPNKNTYNYALSNASMYETFRYLQHAVASCEIKSIILSIDFLMFEKTAGSPIQFQEQRLKVDPRGKTTPWRIKNKLQDSIPALLSLTAFKASIRTVRKQESMPISFQCSAPQQGHSKILNKGGHYKFIMETNRRIIKQFSQNHDREHYELSLKYYADFLQSAHKNNIKVILLIPPSHASLYEALSLSKIKNHFNNWISDIVYINARTSSKLNKKTYTIFNFSGYNNITTEEIPIKEKPEEGMKWFWESLHFKNELGYHMLDRIFSYNRMQCSTPADFGVKITSKNLKAYHKKQLQLRKTYISTHPEIMHDINSWN